MGANSLREHTGAASATQQYDGLPTRATRSDPDLHGGRVLELDSIDGHASNTVLFGPLVELKLVVKETGRLSGCFSIRMTLQVDAARELAATLNRLPDTAEQP